MRTHSRTKRVAPFGSDPCKHLTRVDCDESFVTTVDRMDTRRRMILDVHPYGYAVEPRDRRHNTIV